MPWKRANCSAFWPARPAERRITPPCAYPRSCVPSDCLRSLLSARDLTLRRGPEPLFEKVNFTVFRGNKVGITGANGSGKSSLFAAILGELGADRGDIDLPANLKIAHLEQEIAASSRAAIEFVLDGDSELRGVLAAIEDAEKRDAAMALAELYSSLEAIDGYRA